MHRQFPLLVFLIQYHKAYAVDGVIYEPLLDRYRMCWHLICRRYRGRTTRVREDMAYLRKIGLVTNYEEPSKGWCTFTLRGPSDYANHLEACIASPQPGELPWAE